jgi:signal transduction histidine kinase
MSTVQLMTYPDATGTDIPSAAAHHTWLGQWLGRLGGALARPRPDRPGGDDGEPHEPQSVDPRLEARLRHAQKMELAGRLATGLVHDFNNALLVAQACLAAIAESPASPESVRDQANHAAEALRRASAMARRLGKFGRPDDGSREIVDLNELVRGTLRLASPITGPAIDVDLRCHAQALPVHVDPGQIEQAVLNLCFNARDAMPEGGTLRITTRYAVRCRTFGEDGRGQAPTVYAMVEVADSGTGIPPELQSMVFEPFFTTKAVDRSSGLGLAMVGETARAHGGVVEFTSSPAGTAFRLLFPAANR